MKLKKLKHLPAFLFLFIISSSCIPLRIPPTIKEDKVMIAKKFKRKLPKRYAFIFEDPKEAGEFYNYINTKYNLNHTNVEDNVPFIIDDNTYFLSFRETEIPSKALNLTPMIVNGALENNNLPTLLNEDNQISRVGNWYLVLTVSDNDMKDALHTKYKSRDKIVKFLRETRLEYFNTYNYNEVWLKK